MTNVMQVPSCLFTALEATAFLRGLHPKQESLFFWPELLSNTYPNLKVITVTYPSAPDKDGLSVYRHAKQIRQKLSLDEQCILDKPLVFICHSMGGLIAKQIISSWLDAQNGLTKLRGVKFFCDTSQRITSGIGSTSCRQWSNFASRNFRPHIEQFVRSFSA